MSTLTCPGFRIGTRLVEDADGAWFRAVREQDGRSVLLKAPSSDHPTPLFLARLQHELELAADLDPRWALRPLKLEQCADRPVLVLEDPGGEPIARLLGEATGLGRFLAIAQAIAEALAGAHALGLIHRDLKPTHIWVEGAQGRARLGGFGIAARATRDNAAGNLGGLVEGTLAYMAPEQTGRMNRAIDYRTDFYSLGVVFYQLLTAALPCTGADPLEWMHCHVAMVPKPPAALRPEIPPALSELVMKLLQKEPEARYQTAAGLIADLARCQRQWQAHGRIEPFPLGEADVSDRFQLPQKLYGREREVAMLTEAFERVVSSGAPELMLVSGYPGIGKTSLVNELHKPILASRAFFVSGKFDQYKRGIPYTSVTHAVAELVQELLAASSDELASWRQRLMEALGLNAQLMVDLVPRLELIIGKQPSVPELPLSETRSRFQLVFRRFLAVFALPEHPLVFFLDDLQWLDSASLELFQDVITHADTRHLFLVGAYRDNEVSPSHPLMGLLEEVRRAGVAIHEIVLAPLSIAQLTGLVADTLRCRPDDAEPLAALIHQKTAGTPYFATQFLAMLFQEGLITFDPPTAGWRWELERIRTRGFTDNVVELMVTKLKRLPAETQDVLKVAACIGGQFDLPTLAVTSGNSEEVTRRHLGEAVREGLIRQAGERYQFGHDRIQQAAYSLIPEERRQEVHHAIGKLLWDHTPPAEIEERIFDLVNHLNLGASLLSPEERIRVAELNLLAGQRARSSIAYADAASELAAGMALLPPDGWARHYELTYALHLNRAECEYLSGNVEEAQRLLALLPTQARTRLDRAAPFRLEVTLYTTLGQFDRAISAALEGLRVLGVELPFPTSRGHLTHELQVIREELGDQPIEALLDRPLKSDPETSAALDILTAILPAAYFTDMDFHFLVGARMVTLGLQRGHTAAAPIGYVTLGWVLGTMFGQYREGYRFGKLAIDLVDRHRLAAQRSHTSNIMGTTISYWNQPIGTDLDLQKAGFQAGVDVGDLNMAGFCLTNIPQLLLIQGVPLVKVWSEVQKQLDFTRKLKNEFQASFGLVIERFILALQGPPPDDASAFDAELPLLPSPIVRCFVYVFRLKLCFLYGDVEGAMDAMKQADELLWTIFGQPQMEDYLFYHALFLASRHEQLPARERPRSLQAVLAARERFRVWAENSPENFGAKYELLAAECLRLEGDVLEAMRRYERAIASARDGGFLHLEGIANERAAGLGLAQGFETSARGYLREARYAYLRWGANGKVTQLERAHPHLRERPALTPGETLGVPAEGLDLLTVVKASQAISRSIVLDELVGTLMRFVLQHAGADVGYLILVRDGEPWVEAAARAEGEVQGVGRPLASTELPRSVIQYVMRTREVVILDDPAGRPPYAADEYFALRRPRSILCLPLVKQAAPVGVLYLENNLTTGAFTPARLQVLELLAAQAAISLENASLFAERQRAEAELRALNASLEQRVTDRTAQLEAANQELEAFSYSVSHDLRVPLRAIDNFSVILAEDHGAALPQAGRDVVADMRAAVRRMRQLIDDLLMLSRLTRGEMRREAVDLSALARDIAEGLRRGQPEREVEFVVAPGLVVSGDGKLLRVALENLLGNAWKYTSRHPRARIEVGVLEQAGHPVYFVQDDGAGFDMAYADRLFQPFQRLHGPDEFEGTGIGLATVQRIVHRHGGRVWAEAAVEKGATVFFSLGQGP